MHQIFEVSIKKFAMLVLFLFSSTMLIISVYSIINEYLMEPVSTESNFVFETNVDNYFPEFIICNHQIANFEMLKFYNLTNVTREKSTHEKLQELIRMAHNPEEFYQANATMDINRVFWRNTNANYFDKATIRKVGIKREEFIVDCVIKDYQNHQNINCMDAISEYYSNEFAMCQILSLPVTMKATSGQISQAISGIRLNIYIKPDETSGILSAVTGIRITTQDPKFPILPQLEGLDISPGQEVSIAFQRVVTYKYKRKQLPCIDPEITLRHKFPGIEWAFNNFTCEQMCASYYMNSTCGCITLQIFSSYNDAKICNLGDPKVSRCYALNFNKLFSEVHSCMKKYCFVPCYRVHYKITTNQMRFPSEHFLPSYVSELLGKQNLSDEIRSSLLNSLKMNTSSDFELLERLRKQFIHLHMYRASPETEIVKENSIYTSWKLLSNIGGCMGMFLGLSVMSILDIFTKTKNYIEKQIPIFTSYFSKKTVKQ